MSFLQFVEQWSAFLITFTLLIIMLLGVCRLKCCSLAFNRDFSPKLWDCGHGLGGSGGQCNVEHRPDGGTLRDLVLDLDLLRSPANLFA